MRMYSDKIILNLQEKQEFYNSFASLYKSGMPVIDVFRLIYDYSSNEKIKMVCSEIIRNLDRGKNFENAIKFCRGALGEIYTSLLCAGELSGTLDEVLHSITVNISKQKELKSNIVSALVYPVCMFFFALAVAMFFQFFILPVLSSSITGEPIVNTGCLLTFAVIKILVVFAAIFSGLFFLNKNDNLKKILLNFIFKLKIFNNLIKNYCFANFFYIFSLAYDAGVTVADSLLLANSVVNLPDVNKKLRQAYISIRNGQELSKSLNYTGIFSGYAMSQVSAGEKAGELGKMLNIVASDYEHKLDSEVKILHKLLEPVMVLIIGVMVGFIAVNFYKTYYNAIFSML